MSRLGPSWWPGSWEAELQTEVVRVYTCLAGVDEACGFYASHFRYIAERIAGFRQYNKRVIRYFSLCSNVVIVQLLSRVLIIWDCIDYSIQASLSITNSWSLFKLMSIESVMPSNYLILCSPLLLLPSIFPSIRVFSKESALRIRWPKYWVFSFSTCPSNEYTWFISFRIDRFDLLAVQGTYKSLLHHHNSKVSILLCSAFFMGQLSHLIGWLEELWVSICVKCLVCTFSRT